ncbi:MAG: helicase C-terminal domain-containing protein [Candidatus Heimdallarchaeaceae archaeon]
MNSDNEYIFCPDCGKLLIVKSGHFYCQKCKSKFEITNSKNNSDVMLIPRTPHPSQEEDSKKSQLKESSDITEETWKKYFPYTSIRPLQKKIMETVTENRGKKSHFIIQAANGVGKTVAVLSATLPITRKKGKKIIYCCRTHQQMSRVISELQMIKELNAISAVALRGRKELCLHPILTKFAVDAKNASDICRYLKKERKCRYFNKLGNKEILSKVEDRIKSKVLDSKELVQIGKSYEICPAEISIKLLKNVDVIATSYQYLFNPFIRKTFLGNIEKELEDIILIIDEAHNLPATAIDISSITLSNYSIDNAQTEAAKNKLSKALNILEPLSDTLLKKSNSLQNGEEKRVDPNEFITLLEQRMGENLNLELIETLIRLGEEVKELQIKRNRAPLSYISTVGNYLLKLYETRNDNRYAHFIIKDVFQSGQSNPKILTLSLDPRTITKEILDKVYTSISISGTLEPIDAYISLIGLDRRMVSTLDLPSPYNKEQHLTIVVDKISSKLEDRVPATYNLMIEMINSIVNATPKNIGVFCASYSVMNSLLESGLEKTLSKPLFIAHQGISSTDNDELITKFKNESKKTGAVLMSVLGGRLSEGSDYPAGEMQSVIIIGIPYAKPSPTIDATIQYLDTQFPTKGREYGYNIPALTRASQAAGRPIRSLEDFAVIVLLDYRYARHYYKKHLPTWLKQNLHVVQPDKDQLYEKVKQFYDYHS